MGKYQTPQNAPFKFVFDRSFVQEIINMVGEIYGTSSLIGALKDADQGVRWSTVEMLGKTGDPCVVKPLISALKDEDKAVRFNARYALGKITGKDFGEDQERWKKWWEENKEKFLKKK